MVSGTMGRDIEVQPKYFVEYEEEAANLVKRAKPLDALRKHAGVSKEPEIARAIAQIGKPESDIVWMPIRGRKTDLVMLVDRQTGRPLRAIEVDPWADPAPSEP
jgi:hypothetical protein